MQKDKQKTTKAITIKVFVELNDSIKKYTLLVLHLDVDIEI